MNLVRLIRKNQSCNCRQIISTCRMCTHNTGETSSCEEKNIEKKEVEDSSSIDDILEPTNCCMSGCTNCVWIQYAEKVSATLEKCDADLQKVIIEKVQDPNMKAFLTMELRCRNLLK